MKSAGSTLLPRAAARQTVFCKRPPTTTEDRLRDMAEMLRRVNDYTEFMCRLGSLQATSIEARDRAIAAFHERMVVLEGQLAGIHDEFKLG